MLRSLKAYAHAGLYIGAGVLATGLVYAAISLVAGKLKQQ